ncbi:MAG: histidine phosphatase family protein [Chloroflexota bacterium]|nr:histidine phosphatase family protein [Chloroflexota bacterium]
MLLYLVRHAMAGDPDPVRWPDDRQRPLTAEGEQELGQGAGGLRRLAAGVDVVLSSRLARAWQSARILRDAAGWPEPAPLQALEPGTPATMLAEALRPHGAASSLALVGHEPSLHELASYLLAGDAARVRIVMRPGGVACLTCPDGPRPGRAALEWLLQPTILAP